MKKYSFYFLDKTFPHRCRFNVIVEYIVRYCDVDDILTHFYMMSFMSIRLFKGIPTSDLIDALEEKIF